MSAQIALVDRVPRAVLILIPLSVVPLVDIAVGSLECQAFPVLRRLTGKALMFELRSLRKP
jgi:hypothetical protein